MITDAEPEDQKAVGESREADVDHKMEGIENGASSSTESHEPTVKEEIKLEDIFADDDDDELFASALDIKMENSQPQPLYEQVDSMHDSCLQNIEKLLPLRITWIRLSCMLSINGCFHSDIFSSG